MTSPADRIRAKLEALHPTEIDDAALVKALEALLPVVEKRREWHEPTCPIGRTIANRKCACPAMEAEQALHTAAFALGAEHD